MIKDREGTGGGGDVMKETPLRVGQQPLTNALNGQPQQCPSFPARLSYKSLVCQSSSPLPPPPPPSPDVPL